MEEEDNNFDNSIFSLVFGGDQREAKTDDGKEGERVEVEENDDNRLVETTTTKEVVMVAAGGEQKHQYNDEKSSDDDCTDIDDSTQFIEKVIQQCLKQRDTSNGTADTAATSNTVASSSLSVVPQPPGCCPNRRTTTAASSGTNSTGQSSRNPLNVVDPRLQVRYDNRGGPDFKAQADSRSLIMSSGGDGGGGGGGGIRNGIIGVGRGGGIVVRAEPVVAGAPNAVAAADFYGQVVQRRGRLIFDQMHSHAAVDLVSAVVEQQQHQQQQHQQHQQECSPVHRERTAAAHGRRRPSKRSQPQQHQQQSNQHQQQQQVMSSGGSWWRNHHHQRHHRHDHDADRANKKPVRASIISTERRFWLMIISLALSLNFVLVIGTTALGLFLSGNMPGQRQPVVPSLPPYPPPVSVSPSPAPTGSQVASTTTTTTAGTGVNETFPPHLIPVPPPPNEDDILVTGNITDANITGRVENTFVPTMAPVTAGYAAPTVPTEDYKHHDPEGHGILPQPQSVRVASLAPKWIAVLVAGSVILEAAIVVLLLLLHRRWKESIKVLRPEPFDGPETTTGSEPVVSNTFANAPSDSNGNDDENDTHNDNVECSYGIF